MKRAAAFLFAVFAVCTATHAEVRISENFYLNNEPLPQEREETAKILPSTLRLVLDEGEAEVISASVSFGDADTFTWSLVRYSGAAEIYPRGSRCTVLGVREGEERLLISDGAMSAYVDVSVKKPPSVRTRTFDYGGGEAEEKAQLEGAADTLVCALAALGAALLIFAAASALKRRGENGK